MQKQRGSEKDAHDAHMTASDMFTVFQEMCQNGNTKFLKEIVHIQAWTETSFDT